MLMLCVCQDATHDIWRKRVKNDYLGQKLIDKTDKEIIKTLTKRLNKVESQRRLRRRARHRTPIPTVSLVGYTGEDLIDGLKGQERLDVIRFHIPTPAALTKIRPLYLIWRIQLNYVA